MSLIKLQRYRGIVNRHTAKVTENTKNFQINTSKLLHKLWILDLPCAISYQWVKLKSSRAAFTSLVAIAIIISLDRQKFWYGTYETYPRVPLKRHPYHLKVCARTSILATHEEDWIVLQIQTTWYFTEQGCQVPMQAITREQQDHFWRRLNKNNNKVTCRLRGITWLVGKNHCGIHKRRWVNIGVN